MAKREVKKKINLLGNPSVGKTSLILRFVNDMYDDKYLKTLGTNIYTKEVKTMGANMKLVIHDIMGEKSYESVQKSVFSMSSGAILVADVTSRKTLDDIIDYWIPRYQDIAGDDKPMYLAVNKTDLENKEITKDIIIDEISSHFNDVFFTSAKTGKGVRGAFHELAISVLLMMHRAEENTFDEDDNTEMDTTKDFLGAIFTLISDLEEFTPVVQREILKKSGIDEKYLDQHIKEEKAIAFAGELENWCERSGNIEAAEKIRDIIYQFSGKYSIRRY